MIGVHPIGREPLRAIVIRRTTNDRFSFLVAAMMRAEPGRKASYVDTKRVLGADDLAKAWETARGEASRTGLPIIDTVSPPRRGPGGGLRLAA